MNIVKKSIKEEMSAVDYIKERQRLHDSMNDNCEICPLNIPNSRSSFCGLTEKNHPQMAVSIVAEWAKAHPETPKEKHEC